MFNNVYFSFEELELKIDEEIQNHYHLKDIRLFNHNMLSVLGNVKPLLNAHVLDVGASIHGYALEKALMENVKEYVGIDFSIEKSWGAKHVEIEKLSCEKGNLIQMDAHSLVFDDEYFDHVLCISGFEHFSFPETVLSEIIRVLKPGGVALISYEPIWTCHYGHHLHHFGSDILGLVPFWGHLFLTREQMLEILQEKGWPKNAPISLQEAVFWIYRGRDINRLDVGFHRSIFKNIIADMDCNVEIKWNIELVEDHPEIIPIAKYVSEILPKYKAEDLLVKGFSICFEKKGS